MADEQKVEKLPEEEKPKAPPKKLVDVTILHTTPVTDGRIMCVTSDNRNCYLVPRSQVVWDVKAKFAINLDDKNVERVYDWEEEIEKMLPNRDEMKNNIRRSLWLSGSLKKGDVKPKALRTAFPFNSDDLK